MLHEKIPLPGIRCLSPNFQHFCQRAAVSSQCPLSTENDLHNGETRQESQAHFSPRRSWALPSGSCEGGSHPSLPSRRATEEMRPHVGSCGTRKCVPGNGPEAFLKVTSESRNVHLTPSFLHTDGGRQPFMAVARGLGRQPSVAVARGLGPCFRRSACTSRE